MANADLQQTLNAAKKAYDDALGAVRAEDNKAIREAMTPTPEKELVPLEPPGAKEQALIAERAELQAMIKRGESINVAEAYGSKGGIVERRIKRLSAELEELETVRIVKQAIAIVEERKRQDPAPEFLELRTKPQAGDRVLLYLGFLAGAGDLTVDGKIVKLSTNAPVSFVTADEAPKFEAAIAEVEASYVKRYAVVRERARYVVLMPEGVTLAELLRARVELDRRPEQSHVPDRSWIKRLTSEALTYLDPTGEARKAVQGAPSAFF